MSALGRAPEHTELKDDLALILLSVQNVIKLLWKLPEAFHTLLSYSISTE